MQCHTLDTAANHMRTGLLDDFTVTANSSICPKLPESLCRLIHQFLRVRKEQDTTTTALGIQNGSCGLSRTGCMIEKRNGLAVVSHLL